MCLNHIFNVEKIRNPPPSPPQKKPLKLMFFITNLKRKLNLEGQKRPFFL
jgi:hypothetical protein